MALVSYNSLLTCATGASFTYASLNGIKEFQLGDSRDLLDVTDFADGNVRARLAALRDVSLSLSGDFEPTDTGFKNIKSGYDTGTAVCFQLFNSAVATTQGYAFVMQIESMDISGSVDGKVEVSISAMIDASAGSAIFTL